MAERHVPVIEMVGDRPIVLSASFSAAERTLVLLYNHNGSVPVSVLRVWAEYANATRWVRDVLRGLAKSRMIHVEGEEVHLLTPGSVEAERLIAEKVG